MAQMQPDEWDKLLRDGLDFNTRLQLNLIAIRSGIMWGLMAATVAYAIVLVADTGVPRLEAVGGWFLLAGGVRYWSKRKAMWAQVERMIEATKTRHSAD